MKWRFFLIFIKNLYAVWLGNVGSEIRFGGKPFVFIANKVKFKLVNKFIQ